MILFKNGAEMAGWTRKQRAAGRQIGFIPTMGALHAGHLSLVDASRKALPLTLCSIFVNPTQFNDPKDFRKYPITIENDIYLLEKAGVDALFLPGVEEMYPDGMQNLEKYELGRLETLWEGKFRPGHFQGVCQVVRRLLDYTLPDHLFMGQKDYQQCLVIRRLLDLTGSAIELHICPIMREADGLAMSSRNQRLSADEREKAPAIYQALSWLNEHLQQEGSETVLEQAKDILLSKGLRPEYIALADAKDLEPLNGKGEPQVKDAAALRAKGSGEPIAKGISTLSSNGSGRAGEDQSRASGAAKSGETAVSKVVALVAAYLGEVRLIDNLLLKDH